MAATGCVTTVRRIDWGYPERVEDVVNSVLSNASPPWEVSITASSNRNAWLVVAKRQGDTPFSALLTEGLHTPEHMRRLVAGFLRESH